MPNIHIPKPTASELEILNVLWHMGPATVRDVLDALPSERNSGYTTVLKFMQIMTEKGLLRREEQGRAHLYSPVVTQENSQRRLLGDLMDRAFGGAAHSLVMQALTERPASKEELAEIRELLDRLEAAD